MLWSCLSLGWSIFYLLFFKIFPFPPLPTWWVPTKQRSKNIRTPMPPILPPYHLPSRISPHNKDKRRKSRLAMCCLPGLQIADLMHTGNRPLHQDTTPFKKWIGPLVPSQGLWWLPPTVWASIFLAAVRPAHKICLCCRDRYKEESSLRISTVRLGS